MFNPVESCSSIEIAEKIWNELVNEEKQEFEVSSKKLVKALPKFIKSFSKKKLLDLLHARHIHGKIKFNQFLCLVASLETSRSFKAHVAFKNLSKDNKTSVTEEDFVTVASLIIPDEALVKSIFGKVDASGLGEASEQDFINFLPKETNENRDLSSFFADVGSDLMQVKKGVSQIAGNESDTTTLNGTSPLQLQIGYFRLVQGAAYRCFRASYTANSETHLRAHNLPYSITNFVSFVDRITRLYIDSGIIETKVITEAEKLCHLIQNEYKQLQARVKNWDSIEKDSHMLRAENLLENEALKTEDEHKLFLSVVEMILSIGIDGDDHFSIDHPELALNEINMLRLKEELSEMNALKVSQERLDNARENFIESWERVIIDDGDSHVPGSIMPVRFWYEDFMPQLLLVCSAHTNAELHEIESENESDLDKWFQTCAEDGRFEPFALDLNKYFLKNSLKVKKSIKQAWRLTEHYLNGVQKRREREEFGRNDGYLSEYVTFVDIYLGQKDVELSEMRISFPYFIGPATWRFMHTMAEIACTKKNPSDFINDFKQFFRSLATVYPCPYCRYHLNRYVVQNKEINRYPLEYLFLGFNRKNMDLTISLEDKLDTISSAQDMRLFVWKLHNTVSSSIARSEEWFHTEKDPLYTNRYWPSLDAELERAHAFSKISIELSRVYKVYNLLHPVSKLQTLRDEIQYALTKNDLDLFGSCKERFKIILKELESEILSSGYLQDTYMYNPNLIDVAPHFTSEDEAYSRSGHFYEN